MLHVYALGPSHGPDPPPDAFSHPAGIDAIGVECHSDAVPHLTAWEVTTMGLYLYQIAYTSESVAAQIREPQDRIEAVRPAVEAMGVKFLVGGYSFGEYDALVVMEAPDDATAASVALAVAAGGAAKAAKTTKLLSGHEWIEALRKAQGSQYRPAR